MPDINSEEIVVSEEEKKKVSASAVIVKATTTTQPENIPNVLSRSVSMSLISRVQKAYLSCAKTIKQLLILSVMILIMVCLIYNFLSPNDKDIKEETIQNLFKLLFLPNSNPGNPSKWRNSSS